MQSEKIFSRKEETDFCRKWKKATAKITAYLRSENVLKIVPGTRNHLSGFNKLSWYKEEVQNCVSIVKDSAGFL